MLKIQLNRVIYIESKNRVIYIESKNRVRLTSSIRLNSLNVKNTLNLKLDIV